MASRHRLQVYKNPAQLGLNAATGLNGTVTGSSFDVGGFSQLTLEIDHANSSATAIQMYIDVTDDLSGTPTWRPLSSISIAGGTATISDLVYSKTVSANDNWAINLAINYKGMRLRFTSTGGHATNDTITVRARLG